MRPFSILQASLLTAVSVLLAACGLDEPNGSSLVDPDLTFQVGALDGAAHETFGRVGDLATDDRGNVFVLDRQAQLLHAYDPAGDYLGLVSSSGGGPTELGAPAALTGAPDGAIEVLDPRQGRILRFSVRGGQPTWDSNIPLSSFGASICWTDGNRVILTPSSTGPILAVLDESGEAIHTFGEPYREDLGPELSGRYQLLALSAYNLGSIVCTKEPEPRIIILLSQVPLIRAFALDGTLVWERQLEGFRRLRHQAQPGGGVAMVPDPGDDPLYEGAGLAISGDSILVSLGVEVDGSESHPFETLLLSAGDGREMSRSRLPFAIQELDGDIAYGHRHSPFPEIVGFTWRDLFR